MDQNTCKSNSDGLKLITLRVPYPVDWVVDGGFYSAVPPPPFLIWRSPMYSCGTAVTSFTLLYYIYSAFPPSPPLSYLNFPPPHHLCFIWWSTKERNKFLNFFTKISISIYVRMWVEIKLFIAQNFHHTDSGQSKAQGFPNEFNAAP